MTKINWKQVLKLVQPKELRTYLIFVFLAWIIWIMYSRGTMRDFELEAPVVYYGIPDDVKMENEMPQSITFSISDKGSQAWQYLFLDVDTIEVDLTQQFAEGKKPFIHIYFTDYIEAMIGAVSQTCKIVSIDPATYESHYEKVFMRRVPVVLSNEPETDPAFTISGPVAIEPAEVKVRGNRRLVEHVKSVRVDTIRGVFNSPQSMPVRLVGIKGIELLDKDVQVSFNVERMTEKRFTLPITVRNAPKHWNVRVFPKKVDVVFNVGLSRFKTLSSQGMEVIFDCNMLQEGQPTNRLFLESQDSIDGITYKIEPEEVEYIKEAI